MVVKEKNNNYNPNYTENISLYNQNIKKESISIIALFHLNYWCNSEEEKIKLHEIFNENEEKYQLKLKEMYNPDNVFQNKKKENEQKVIKQKQVAMIEYKETFFKKIFNTIKDFFIKK